MAENNTSTAPEIDLEKPEISTKEQISDRSDIEYERAQLLANLPDPDVGKSEEERRAIVSSPSRLTSITPHEYG